MYEKNTKKDTVSKHQTWYQLPKGPDKDHVQLRLACLENQTQRTVTKQHRTNPYTAPTCIIKSQVNTKSPQPT